MPKRKCATPKCNGNVTADFRYCLACARKIRRLMEESGYLQDLGWIRSEENRRQANRKDNEPTQKQTRIHADLVAGRQLTGSIMVGKGKK